MRSWSAVSVCALVGMGFLVSGCASDVNRARKQPRAPERTSLIYNGATVEDRAKTGDSRKSPPPLETEEERQARLMGHALSTAPCDLRLESVPHGISITFFAKPGSALEASDIREQVEMLARMHNKLFQVPEATVEHGPESVPLANEPKKPEHAPLRALMSIPSRASWEETSDGATLTLTADSEQDLADLRAHVRWHAPELLPGVMSDRKRCPDIPSQKQITLYND